MAPQETTLDIISLIGAGNMGSALVRGLIESGKASGEQILAFDIDLARTGDLAKEFGVSVASSASDAIRPTTEILVLAVKPQIMGDVLDGIADHVGEKPLVVSIAAGVSTGFMLSRLGPSARVIRAMPNAAAMVMRSATALCKAGSADNGDLERAVDLFTAVGRAVVVDEKMMNVVTALSASGPGYLFAIMEGLTDGAVRMGLDRTTARELTVETLIGAAAMAAQEGAPFSELKDRITSPGGTTMAGLQVLERSGLRGILMDVLEAAVRRGEELQAGE